MLGWLDERSWQAHFALQQAIASKQVAGAYQHFLSLLEPLPAVDLSGFESEVEGYIRDWITASETPVATVREKSTGRFFMNVFSAMRHAGLTAPSGLTRHFRAVAIADMVMLKLDPRVDWLPVAGEFLADERSRITLVTIRRGMSPAAVGAALEAAFLAPQLAEQLAQFLRSQLPGLGRAYTQERARIDRLAGPVLEYLRTALIALLAIVLGSRLVAPVLFAGSTWDNLGRSLGPWWVPLVALGLLGARLLRRMIREFESRY
jgi:predicted unusual protein kinase regulating ubiquinone biosynthesis (AarF/ABC1/UbiB family)